MNKDAGEPRINAKERELQANAKIRGVATPSVGSLIHQRPPSFHRGPKNDQTADRKIGDRKMTHLSLDPAHGIRGPGEDRETSGKTIDKIGRLIFLPLIFLSNYLLDQREGFGLRLDFAIQLGVANRVEQLFELRAWLQPHSQQVVAGDEGGRIDFFFRRRA